MYFIRTIELPEEVTVGYKMKFEDEFFTIISIENDGDLFKFTIQSDSTQKLYRSNQWSGTFMTVYH